VDPNVFLTSLLTTAGYAAAGLVIWRLWQKWERRRTGMARIALRHGLAYSREDPYNLGPLTSRLFNPKAANAELRNVLAGRWEGMRVRLGEYHYSDRRGDNQYVHVRSVLLVPIDAEVPHVRIAQEHAVLPSGVGIDFESNEFNRRFRVEARDPRFAYKLVDARMMEWLLGAPGRYSYEVHGRWVLVHSRLLPPEQLPVLLRAGKEFVDRIPRLVWAEYGTTTPS